MEEEDDGVLVLDLRDLFQQEEDLRMARLMIAERNESESLERVENPEDLPRLRIAGRGTVTLENDGRRMEILRMVMENPASGEQFILDVGCVKAQYLIRMLNRFYEQQMFSAR
jgi:hypothetical protein